MQQNKNSTTWKIRTEDMPDTMRILLKDYPRDSWESHPGYREKTIHWLGSHQSFRRLTATVSKDTEQYLDGDKSVEEYTKHLIDRGGTLVSNLHGHHGWEDHSYFPELSAADSRFDAGLEILEKDHALLHQVLESFTTTANLFLKQSQHNDLKARDQAGKLHSLSETIEALLQRHLADEEELAVPIILLHRLRG